MDQQKLASCLLSWMAVDTWASGHPLDERRFNLALQQAFHTLGTPIYAEDFAAAMVVNAKAKGQVSAHYQKVIETYAAKADAVGEYLHAIGG